VDQLLNQAQTAQRHGNLAEALILASQAVSAAPTNPQPYYVRGRLYSEDREHFKARVLALPKRENVQTPPINEQLIVELYSK
jgi:Flp pilus assembly protein TadD